VIFYGVLLTLFALTGLAGCATWNAEKATPMLGVRIDVDGQKIHVVDLGPRDSQKPPIVLIHGASVNLRDMKMALGDALSADRRVILIDRPGRGYSDRPSDGWRLDSQAELIHGVVETLGVEKPIIVGQSLGGAVALSYALQYQDEMSGLVLLAAVSHEWPGGVAWYNSTSNIPGVGFLLRRFVIPTYGQLAADSGIEESFAPDIAPENYAKNIGLALLFRPKDFKSNAADIFHLKDEIIRQQDRYGELTLPVAIVTGLSDTTVSPDIHSKTLAGQIDGASLTLLPDTGHALHHSETEIILDVIERVTDGQLSGEEI